MTSSSHDPDATVAESFVVSRSFDYPRERVFAAWSQRDALEKWFAPAEASLRIAGFEFAVGGAFHYCIEAADGGETWGRLTYHEIDAPQRITQVSSFSDADAKLRRNPANELWPLEVTNTLTFVETGDKTLLVLHAAPLGATEDEHDAFFESGKSFKAGVEGMLDLLEAFLSQG
jgi:uncharacterized protein YndB with AHSA1/START domain